MGPLSVATYRCMVTVVERVGLAEVVEDVEVVKVGVPTGTI